MLTVLQVVTERTPWDGGYVGISSFGFGGANVHALLRSPDSGSSTRSAHLASTMTRLVTCAGRTKDGVEATLAEVSRHPADIDMQSLLQSSVGDQSPVTHPYRGAVLVNSTDRRQTVEVQTAKVEILVGLRPLNSQQSLISRIAKIDRKLKQPYRAKIALLQSNCIHPHKTLTSHGQGDSRKF